MNQWLFVLMTYTMHTSGLRFLEKNYSTRRVNRPLTLVLTVMKHAHNVFKISQIRSRKEYDELLMLGHCLVFIDKFDLFIITRNRVPDYW